MIKEKCTSGYPDKVADVVQRTMKNYIPPSYDHLLVLCSIAFTDYFCPCQPFKGRIWSFKITFNVKHWEKVYATTPLFL